MDFGKSSQYPNVCSQSLNRNSFSIKNILNLRDERDMVEFPRFSDEGLENAKCLMPRPIVAPVPLAMGPPPLMYPCASQFGLPLYGPSNWPAITMEQDIYPWTSNSRFIPRHECLSGFTPYMNLRRRRRLSRKKKQRPLFSQQQVQAMEDEFTKHRYITESKRAELSSELGLTETQVKTWFQNRRTKWRKEIKDEVATTVVQTNKKLQERLSGKPSQSDDESCLESRSPESHVFDSREKRGIVNTCFGPAASQSTLKDLNMIFQATYV